MRLSQKNYYNLQGGQKNNFKGPDNIFVFDGKLGVTVLK